MPRQSGLAQSPVHPAGVEHEWNATTPVLHPSTTGTAWVHHGVTTLSNGQIVLILDMKELLTDLGQHVDIGSAVRSLDFA